jgi:hypothetical protein
VRRLRVTVLVRLPRVDPLVRQRALVGVYDTYDGAVRGLTEFAGVRRDGLLRGFDIEGGRATGRVNFTGLISTDPPGGRGIGPL